MLVLFAAEIVVGELNTMPILARPWTDLLTFVLSTGLISLGSDLAFYAIVSGSGVFFQLAYIAPIVAVCSNLSLPVFKKLGIEC